MEFPPLVIQININHNPLLTNINRVNHVTLGFVRSFLLFVSTFQSIFHFTLTVKSYIFFFMDESNSFFVCFMLKD